MSSGSLEERLERVERLLSGQVEVIDVVTGRRRFFVGDYAVRRCTALYAKSCAGGDPFETREDRPDNTGPFQPIGSLPVDQHVALWDDSRDPASWWRYRITATARGMEAE